MDNKPEKQYVCSKKQKMGRETGVYARSETENGQEDWSICALGNRKQARVTNTIYACSETEMGESNLLEK